MNIFHGRHNDLKNFLFYQWEPGEIHILHMGRKSATNDETKDANNAGLKWGAPGASPSCLPFFVYSHGLTRHLNFRSQPGTCSDAMDWSGLRKPDDGFLLLRISRIQY